MSAPTPEQRAEWREVAAKATKGPWRAAIAPHPDNKETPGEYLARALVGGTLWVIWAENDTDDGFDYILPAVTGDGPTSEANARFIEAAHTAVPALLDTLEGAEAERDRLNAQRDAVLALLAADVHVVELRKTTYGLQHGFPCRPHLLDCPVERALNALSGSPAAPGRYRVALVDGELVIGDPVADDFDPLVTDLRRALGVEP